MGKTIDYYNQNAINYCKNTINVAMQNLYDEFESYLQPGARILDLGCGSGRDSKYFLSKGYDVVSVDGAIEICHLAEQYIGKSVHNIKFENFDYSNEFDAIWASASLLHVNPKQMPIVLDSIKRALKNDGILYASWKYGRNEKIVDGKYYLYLDESAIADLFNSTSIEIEYIWVTEDKLFREEKWLNIIGKKRGYQIK